MKHAKLYPNGDPRCGNNNGKDCWPDETDREYHCYGIRYCDNGILNDTILKALEIAQEQKKTCAECPDYRECHIEKATKYCDSYHLSTALLLLMKESEND